MKVNGTTRLLLDVIGDLHDAASFEDFSRVMRESIPKAISADVHDVVCYGSDEPQDDWFLGSPGGFSTEEFEEILAFLIESPDGHPVSRHQLATGDCRPIRVSDLESLSKWRASEFYNRFNRRLGHDHELDCILSTVNHSGTVAISIARHGRDFSKSELEILGQLTRPLSQVINRLLQSQKISHPAGNAVHPSVASLLTPREMEVLLWIVEGKSDLEISKILGRSRHTTSTHVRNLLQKLGVESRLAAAMLFVREQSKNTES